MHDEALLLRVDWKKVRTEMYVEVMFIDGPGALFQAHMMKELSERANPGYAYVVVAREPFETKGVG